jgi:hypothetical protein
VTVKAIARWGHWQPGPLGERDELFDDVEAAFVGDVADQAGAAQVVALVLADAAGEQALAERAPDQSAHAEALDAGQDLALDSAAHWASMMSEAGLRCADRADLAAADQVGHAERVSSMPMPGRGGGAGRGRCSRSAGDGASCPRR